MVVIWRDFTFQRVLPTIGDRRSLFNWGKEEKRRRLMKIKKKKGNQISLGHVDTRGKRQ